MNTKYFLVVLSLVILTLSACKYFELTRIPEKEPGLLPGKCIMSPGFDLEECKVASDGLKIGLHNSMGVDLDRVVFVINTTPSSDITCNQAWDIGSMGKGERTGIHTLCTGNLTKDKLFDADARIIYIKAGKTLDHTARGVITKHVE